MALGWNKLASYEQDIRIEGINKNSSIADKLLEIAQGKTIDELDDFFSYPAFATDVIDLTNNTTDSSNQYLFDNGNYSAQRNNLVPVEVTLNGLDSYGDGWNGGLDAAGTYGSYVTFLTLTDVNDENNVYQFGEAFVFGGSHVDTELLRAGEYKVQFNKENYPNSR